MSSPESTNRESPNPYSGEPDQELSRSAADLLPEAVAGTPNSHIKFPISPRSIAELIFTAGSVLPAPTFFSDGSSSYYHTPWQQNTFNSPGPFGGAGTITQDGYKRAARFRCNEVNGDNQGTQENPISLAGEYGINWDFQQLATHGLRHNPETMQYEINGKTLTEVTENPFYTSFNDSHQATSFEAVGRQFLLNIDRRVTEDGLPYSQNAHTLVLGATGEASKKVEVIPLYQGLGNVGLLHYHRAIMAFAEQLEQAPSDTTFVFVFVPSPNQSTAYLGFNESKEQISRGSWAVSEQGDVTSPLMNENPSRTYLNFSASRDRTGYTRALVNNGANSIYAIHDNLPALLDSLGINQKTPIDYTLVAHSAGSSAALGALNALQSLAINEVNMLGSALFAGFPPGTETAMNLTRDRTGQGHTFSPLPPHEALPVATSNLSNKIANQLGLFEQQPQAAAALHAERHASREAGRLTLNVNLLSITTPQDPVADPKKTATLAGAIDPDCANIELPGVEHGNIPTTNAFLNELMALVGVQNGEGESVE